MAHKRQSRRWAKAQSWIKTKGVPAVFFGRFVAFLRSFIPAAAGVARMPYRKFLPWNIAAGILWGTGSALLGYFAGGNFDKIVTWTGRAGLILLGIAVILLAILGRRLFARRCGRK